MTDHSFFEKPILNSPYEYPAQHWELDPSGQPTNRIINKRRRVELITAIPKGRPPAGSPILAVAIHPERRHASQSVATRRSSSSNQFNTNTNSQLALC